MKRYALVIEAAARNYSAYCPDVPGCVTTGKTLEETVQNMREALVLCHACMAGCRPGTPIS